MSVASDDVGVVRPVPRVDHVMVLLDPAAFADVAASTFLRERFGRLKEKTADSSVAGRYSTLGIAGDNTLIELFNAAVPGLAPLTGGLVFSFEEPGSSRAARAALEASGQVGYHHELVKRAVPGSPDQVPWYHLISVGLGDASPLLLFLNEVTPSYLEAVGAKPAADGTLRRRDYLNATLGPRDGRPLLMQDISAVTLRLRPERAALVTRALAVFGYTATPGPCGTELCGPDLTLRLVPEEWAAERVTEIDVRLGEGGHEAAELRFGQTSRLVIGEGPTARWSFGHHMN